MTVPIQCVLTDHTKTKTPERKIMDSKHKKKEYALFLDESGSPKPNPNDPTPYFAVGGILVDRSDESTVETLLSEFKMRWNINPDTPLHGNEIRSRKKNFSWLGECSKSEQERFLEDLTATIVSCPIVVHACVVSRRGYINRYLDKYGEKTWEMMRSAFSILIERAAKYAAIKDGTVMVYFEKAGKKEDGLIKNYFQELRSSGLPFDSTTSSKYSPISSSQLSSLLRGIEGKTKSNLMIQLADLCLYPVARRKFEPNNRAFAALINANLIVDCCLEPSQVESLGVKYYCFDNE